VSAADLRDATSTETLPTSPSKKTPTSTVAGTLTGKLSELGRLAAMTV
jgi:hypothetical protein